MFRNLVSEEYVTDLTIRIKGDRESYDNYETLAEDVRCGSLNTIGYHNCDEEIKKYKINIFTCINSIKEEMEYTVKNSEELMAVLCSEIGHEIAVELQEKEEEINERIEELKEAGLEYDFCNVCGDIIEKGYFYHNLEVFCEECFEETVDEDEYNKAYEEEESYYSEIN